MSGGVTLDPTAAARVVGELAKRLAHVTAALRDAEQRHRSEMAAANEQLAELRVKHDLITARTAATWEMVDEQLRLAAFEVERLNPVVAAMIR